MNLSKEHPEIYLSAELISHRVQQVGQEISAFYKTRQEELVLVCVLKGAFMFCADLVRHIDKKHSLDFITLSSYKDKKVSSGKIELVYNGLSDLSGKDVLIVEDIVDTGHTLSWLTSYIKTQRPASCKVATFLEKKEAIQCDLTPDFCCFSIENKFVIGYGLDYAEDYRYLPHIGVLL